MSVAASELVGERLEQGVSLYETMLRIRRFEERAGELFEAGEMPGFIHLSIGQEAVAAGVIGALGTADAITATHRGHGHIIAKGGRLGPMMAELMAKADGYCRGKGGSMHIFDLSLGVLGANGILGAGQPIAVGAALAMRVKGTDGVAASFFGEGASAQGAVHEAMNMASVLSLPVLFVAEVNGFAELTPYGVHVGIPELAARGSAYGMPSRTVDGADALAVFDATAEAVTAMRGGGGPALLEARTVRWRGHYEGDPQKYRDQADLDKREDLDPVALLLQRLLDAGVEEERLSAIEQASAAELDAAVEFARASPLPQPSEALEDVYAVPLPSSGGPR